MSLFSNLFGLGSRSQFNALIDSIKKSQRAAADDNKRLRKEIDKLRKTLEQRYGALGEPPVAAAGTMAGVLRRLHQQGPKVQTIIDIGASDSQWSKLAMQYFPQQSYLLVEAQPVHETALQAFASQHGQVQVAMAAAGRQAGEIYFDASDPFGGLASDTPFPNNNMVVPVTTLDQETSNRRLQGPYLIKFDTHGFEVPILEGAAAVLRQTSVIIMECYNFKISPDCLLFPDMCALLATHGFRCVDMADVLHRQRDGALWQMDIVFVRQDAPEFSNNSYS
jgi:FkbM family methyltransferase